MGSALAFAGAAAHNAVALPAVPVVPSVEIAALFAFVVFTAAGFVLGRNYERSEWRYAAEHGKDGFGIMYASGRPYEVRRHVPGPHDGVEDS